MERFAYHLIALAVAVLAAAVVYSIAYTIIPGSTGSIAGAILATVTLGSVFALAALLLDGHPGQ